MIGEKPIVGIVVPSKQDIVSIQDCIDIFKELKIYHKIDVIHSCEDLLKLINYSLTAKAEGLKVIISASRESPSLSSIISSITTLPVIGIPLETNLHGVDSLLSIIQMPAGFPVATMKIGKEGAKNAALLATAILLLLAEFEEDNDLEKRYECYKHKITKESYH